MPGDGDRKNQLGNSGRRAIICLAARFNIGHESPYISRFRKIAWHGGEARELQLIDVVFVAAAAFADYVEPGLSGIEAAFNHEIGRELGFVLRSAAKIDQTLHVVHNTRAQIERQIPASGPNIAHSEAYEGSATFEFPSSDIGSWAAQKAYCSWHGSGTARSFKTRPAKTDRKHQRPRSDPEKPQ